MILIMILLEVEIDVYLFFGTFKSQFYWIIIS